MKRKSLSAVLPLTLAAAFACTSVLAQEAKQPEPVDPLVSVNEEPLSQALFKAFFINQQKGRNQAANNPQAQINALNELVNIMLLAQDASAHKLEQHPDVAAQIALSKTQHLANAAVQLHMQMNEISEEAIEARYQTAYVANPKTEYKTRHIQVETEDEAKAIIALLKNGEDFSAQAKSKSKDTSAENGGSLDWFSSGEIIPEIEAAVTSLEAGQFTQSPVKTDFGWHIVLLEEKRSIPVAKLEDVRNNILQELRQQQLNDYIDSLRSKANIVSHLPTKEEAKQ